MQQAAPGIEAEEFLKAHAGEVTADRLYDLVLASTGSKDQAERAFLARRNAELKSGQPVPE